MQCCEDLYQTGIEADKSKETGLLVQQPAKENAK
jgi:hypothetical protein